MLEPRSFAILLPIIWFLLSAVVMEGALAFRTVDGAGHRTSVTSGKYVSHGSIASSRLRRSLSYDDYRLRGGALLEQSSNYRSLLTARYASSRHHHRQPTTKFKDFEEMLASYKDTPVLVTFHAKFCGPCKLIKKQLAIVSDSLGEQVKMFAVDMEKWPKLGARYQISGLPCIIVFKGGQILDKIEGVETAEEIVRRIKTHVTD